MRTTLKSRLGRAAAGSGNGFGPHHGNGHGNGTFPPAPIPPVTIYRQPEPPPRSVGLLVLKVFGWAALVVLMLAVGTAGGYYLYLHESVSAVNAKSVAVKKAAKSLHVPVAGEPATAIVIGYDHRYSDGKNAPSRSDTIMLIRADPRLNTISLLSLPRDMWVPIHCPGRSVFDSKINAAYDYCGPAGTLATVEALTGLDINYLITVNFRGFMQIVDHVGGVYVDVDRRYLNTHSGPTGYATIDLQPGYQLLSGSDALDFVRFRHTDSDLYRVARQQLFVKALKDRVASDISVKFLALKMPQLVRAITSNTEVAQGGGAPIGVHTLLSYAFFAYGLPAGHVFQSKIEGLEGSSDLTTTQQNVNTAVQEFLHPDVQSPSNATAVALGEKPKEKAPPPRLTTMTVLNGNGIAGSASTAGALLNQRGYQILTPPNGIAANAPAIAGVKQFGYFRSRVYFDPSQRGARPAALQVANLIGSADVARLPASVRPFGSGAMLVAIVGQTFHNSLAPAPIDQTPKATPPQVTPGTGGSIDLLRPYQHRVPFKLLAPTVVESSSYVDPERPIRFYWIDGRGNHKAIRLVYRMGGGNKYWGIEETNWADAPILKDRNFHRSIKGRRYDLYYNGPHLHMVVLRRAGATYWVVNSLLDELSNETMLAIAKGLVPINRIKQ
jgi:LCP family protein required for cell wall assembly